MSEELVTQVLDDEVIPSGGAEDGTTEGNVVDEPFLKINDRQVYKTKDDAIKAYGEASKSAIELGNLRKVAKEFGLNGLTDKELRAYFMEIVQNRQEKAKAAKTSPKVTPNGEEEEVDPETKAALKWLEKHGAKAGYVSKKELEALQTKLDKLEGNSAKAEEEKRDSLISEGQEAVTGWLKDAKTPDGKAVELSEEERVDLEELIAAWVNASDARIKRFYTGGATAQSLIKEGFTKALPIVKEGAVAFPNPAKKVVADGKTKLGLMQKTNKPLPKSGDGGDAVVKKADTSNGGKKPLGVYDPALADKAKALIASMRRDAAGE